ncbi:MAG: O-antigen ligase family protein [Chloroflexi bacterium]|nr:MAG: hypothetical protein CUN54_00185 [Phototrophicales bacterium]RMF79684.1 MAG: O-antigen ligase family protein [Chloroflexota bacterium]
MIPSSKTFQSLNRFDRIQYALLAIIVIVSVVSRPRQQLIQVFDQLRMPIEFQIVSLSIPDYFVIILVITTSGWLVISDKYRQHFVQTMEMITTQIYGIIWVIFAGWLFASLLWSRDATLPRFTTIHVIIMLYMALIVADFVRRHRANIVLYPLVAGAIFQAVLALLQVINNDPLGLYQFGEIDRFPYDPRNFYRAPGLSSHSNYLGGYLMVALFALAILIAFRLQTTHLKDRKNFPFYLIGFLIVLAMIGTLSRSAMLSTTIGAVPLVLVAARYVNKKIFFGAFSLFIIAILVWGLFVLAGPENIRTRILSSREFFFDDSWAVIKDAPVFGVGAGNLMLEISQFTPDEPNTDILPVHNVYLFLWAEVGIIGLAIFVTALLLMLRHLANYQQITTLVWTSCLLAIAVAMLFDNYFWAVQPFRVLLFWAIGVWWGVMNQSSNVNNVDTTEAIPTSA